MRAGGTVFGIIDVEGVEHWRQLVRRKLAALRLDPARDHCSRPAADQIARGIVGDWRQALALKHHVEGADEIGRGIYKGAVKVEDRHRPARAGRRRNGGDGHVVEGNEAEVT